MKKTIYFLCLLLLCVSCKDDPADEEITLQVDKTPIMFQASGGSVVLEVKTNVTTYQATVATDAQSWCSTSISGNRVTITATKNEGSASRNTTITVIAGDKKESVSVSQSFPAPEPEGDTKIKILSAQASSEETASADHKIASSFDGDYNTIWHTQWNAANKFPYTITYQLEETDQVNYLVYYPRSDNGSNGHFGQIEIQAQYAGSDEFVRVMGYNCGQKGTESKIMFTNPVVNPKAMRIVINSGLGGYASCAEMEFYRGTGKEVNHGTEVPLGGNTYVSVAGNSGNVTDNGLTDWSDTETQFSTFFKVKQQGDLELYLKYRGNTGESEIEITIDGEVFPVTLPVPQTRDAFAYVGKLTNVQPGYVKVDMKGVSKAGNVFAIPTALAVSGTASPNMTYVSNAFSFYWGRRGPSVHMNYTMPEEDCEWFYNEVTVPEGMDPVGSYFMSNGFSGGYFGMQVNTESERRVLFSVWSPYETDDPTTIPEEYRVKVAKTGEGVKDNDFGNEGSGGQTYLIYNWQAGSTYKFLTRIRPVEDGYSEYTSWFFLPETGKWKLISQLLRPKTQTYYKSAHSFLENFNNQTGHLTRRAYYNNQWARTTDGNWIELTKGTFSVDNTGTNGWRLDYQGGADSQGFYLQNCGFFDETTQKGTSFERPKTNIPPSINLDELE